MLFGNCALGTLLQPLIVKMVGAANATRRRASETCELVLTTTTDFRMPLSAGS